MQVAMSTIRDFESIDQELNFACYDSITINFLSIDSVEQITPQDATAMYVERSEIEYQLSVSTLDVSHKYVGSVELLSLPAVTTRIGDCIAFSEPSLTTSIDFSQGPFAISVGEVNALHSRTISQSHTTAPSATLPTASTPEPSEAGDINGHLNTGTPTNTFTFHNINFPGTINTIVQGINNDGELVGNNSGNGSAFTYASGLYAALLAPYPQFNGHTSAWGLNDYGQIVGHVNDFGGGAWGYLDSGGTFTTIHGPLNAGQSLALGINNAGMIVGYFAQNGQSHGFMYDGNTYITIDDPLATSPENGTTVFGINNKGELVGTYQDHSGYHGFLYSGGIYTSIDHPLAAGLTYLQGINSSDEIVGVYRNSNLEWHSFLYSAGAFTNIDDQSQPTGTFTIVHGINDAGQIVGEYGKYIYDPNARGFEADPIGVVLDYFDVRGPNKNSLGFHVKLDSTVLNASNSTSIIGALKAAFRFYADTYTTNNPITVRMYVDWGKLGIQNAVASNVPSLAGRSYTFDTINQTLKLGSDPVTDASAQFALTTPEARAYGLQNLSDASLLTIGGVTYDGKISFGASPGGFKWGYDSNDATSTTIPLRGSAEHEISEVLGRTQYQGKVLGDHIFTPYDLYRYVGPGQWDGNGTPGAYLSNDEGATALNAPYTFFGDPKYDYGDWSTGGDAFGTAEDDKGLPASQPVSADDIEAVHLLGYQIAGGSVSVAYDGLGNVGFAWTIPGVANLDGVGGADILWRNNTTGDVASWDVNSAGGFTYHWIGNAGSSWNIQAAANFDNDGVADILWRNSTTGDVALWNVDPNGGFTYQGLGNASSDWNIQGAADFCGDGHTGILWRNNATDDVALWNVDPNGGL